MSAPSLESRGSSRRVNISLDRGLLEAIDDEARQRRMTRSAFLATAARHGVSMEEEMRRIIRLAVSSPERLGDFAVDLSSPAYGGKELELPIRESRKPMEFPE